MGRWIVQIEDDLQRRLSLESTKVQVWATTVSPKRLSEWHSLFVFAGWGKRLETSHHNQTDPLRYPRSIEWTQCQRSCSSWSLHYLLVIFSRPYLLSKWKAWNLMWAYIFIKYIINSFLSVKTAWSTRNVWERRQEQWHRRNNFLAASVRVMKKKSWFTIVLRKKEVQQYEV